MTGVVPVMAGFVLNMIKFVNRKSAFALNMTTTRMMGMTRMTRMTRITILMNKFSTL